MKPKVLLVDDDEEFAEMIRYSLERQGFEFDRAADGVRGLHLARTGLPDVILLDLMLPDLDGSVVCEILQAQPSTRDIPVIILSALDWLTTPGSRKKLPISNYFQKPVELKFLAEGLRVAFDERQARLRFALADKEA